MAELAQFALQNELFFSTGLGFLLTLPPFNYYLQPVIYTYSALDQFQLTPRAPTTVTQIATTFPEATAEALITATTTAVPLTIFDTITEHEASISTVIDRRYITKWTHLLVDSATQCPTSTSYPEVTALFHQEHTPKVQLNEVACAPLTMPWLPWAWTNWILLAFLALLTFVLGLLFLVFRVDLVNARAKRHLREATDQTKTIVAKLNDCLENSSKEIEDRNIMLRFLGVYEKSDRTPEKQTLVKMVKARKQSLAAEKVQSQELEAENEDLSKKIQELESETVRLDRLIKTNLSERYVPDVDHSFQLLLDGKQREIDRWRDRFYNSDSDKNAIASQKLHEEKDAELLELRRLPTEIKRLQQGLDGALKQIANVEQEKKDQGVADRRRWNEEKCVLSRKHSDAVKALKADLQEARRSTAAMEKAAQPQLKHISESPANGQIFEYLKKEQATLSTEAVELRQRIWDTQTNAESVIQDLGRIRKERDSFREALKDLKDKRANDRGIYENEKRVLHQHITQPENEAQSKDKHSPAAGIITETKVETPHVISKDNSGHDTHQGTQNG